MKKVVPLVLLIYVVLGLCASYPILLSHWSVTSKVIALIVYWCVYSSVVSLVIRESRALWNTISKQDGLNRLSTLAKKEQAINSRVKATMMKAGTLTSDAILDDF